MPPTKIKPAFILPSVETKTDYRIYVVAPRGRLSPGPWPAIVFMDGDDQFAAGVAAYRILRRARKVPPLLLIGVGYGASYMKPGNKRGRDYTPTPHRDEPTSGGADQFLKFLRDTLWPEIARRYPINPRQRGVAGHSLGSLLVLFALFQARPFFTHFLASAPSIWWDNRSLLRIAQRRRRNSPTLRAQLFLSVGEKDSESMRADLELFERALAGKPFRGLQVIRERFPKHDHFNVLPVAFRSGLAALFPANA